MISEPNLFGDVTRAREGMLSRILGGLSSLFEPRSAIADMPGDSPVHFDMVREDSVFARLGEQLTFAFGELRRDPAGFFKVLVSPDANDPDQIKTRQAAWALTVVVPVMTVGAFLFGVALYWFFVGPSMNLPELAFENRPLEITDISDVKMPEVPKAAEKAGGGGGGGRQEVTPPMKGKLPTPSLQDTIVAPTTHTPPKPPSLPMTPTIKVDPSLIPPNLDPKTMGAPDGVVGPPSDGPGRGGGIGTGSGGGVGSGGGQGAGPGNGWNMGGGDPRLGGGTGADVNRNKVVSKIKILNSPRPNYTEQARQNKTQGNVSVRALFGADGRIKQARVVKGLPDGLNEKAIEAVYRISFQPARNGAGSAVDQWMVISVNFTIR